MNDYEYFATMFNFESSLEGP